MYKKLPGIYRIKSIILQYFILVSNLLWFTVIYQYLNEQQNTHNQTWFLHFLNKTPGLE